jgi:predicted ATPase
LLGREETLDAATNRVRGGARLLPVTGYGGTGKTRFSIELFHRLVPEMPAAPHSLSLAAVTAASSVLPTVCIALEIPEAHGRSALDALCTVIGRRRMLIVLDNLEQVIDVAEEICGARRAMPGAAGDRDEPCAAQDQHRD